MCENGANVTSFFPTLGNPSQAHTTPGLLYVQHFTLDTDQHFDMSDGERNIGQCQPFTR